MSDHPLIARAPKPCMWLWAASFLHAGLLMSVRAKRGPQHVTFLHLLYRVPQRRWRRGAGFVQFVLRLKKGQYLEQFGQYAWTHMILLVVFIPTSFFVSNIFDGLIWFLLPCALVIINDIGAYLVGEHTRATQHRGPVTSSLDAIGE